MSYIQYCAINNLISIKYDMKYKIVAVIGSPRFNWAFH